ncbi:hypothetical protein [Methylobacterium sp. 17Sr1-1]|uniref:hypothetical protein n=1 Tax=Methylobacterium sp. 17Sr1-1 TaxID=2202826 RepID=UPI000D6EE92E|nr:hypothetical protein [Methylobacterium sp. 17Sr1-1]AWN54735.1 hypothetical protein DK412_26545 [Methylobacterium sp. 17Sr1-1]
MKRAIAYSLAMSFSVISCAQAFDTDTLGQRGSLLLSDLDRMLRENGLLRQQTDAAMREAGLNADTVRCEGTRFPGTWQHLGGYRVAPYICAFGDRRLVIRADVRITDVDGDSYAKNTETARRYARHYTESNLKWTWFRDPQ